MDEHIKKTFKFLRSERLTDNERIQMRNVLRSVMHEHPLQVPVAARSSNILSYFSSAALRPVGFAFALMLVVGIGTSYASETALPGDPLYAIKVGFTEPIQGVLAVSPVAKAEWDTELLSRRLEEAATLASQGSLNDSSREAIEAQISKRAARVNQNIEHIKSSDEGVLAASSIENDLEARLVGHERVLTGLSVDLPEEAPAIAPLLNKVRAQATTINSQRRTTEYHVNTQPEEVVRAAASGQQKNAREKVRLVRERARTKHLQASTTVEASSSAKAIEDAIATGEKQMDEGRYGEALTTFQATIRASKAVEVNLEAEDRLGGNSGRSREEHEE